MTMKYILAVMALVAMSGCATVGNTSAAVSESPDPQIIKQIEQDLERLQKSSSVRVI
jgi:uncharacterized protein YceK